MDLQQVSDILWRERQLLELLVFKLEEEQLILASGRPKWLPQATREVEMVVKEIRLLEKTRAGAVDRLARHLGISPGPSLGQLVEAVPGPWQNVFREHRRAFLEFTETITSLTEANRELLQSGADAAREALAWLTSGESDVAKVSTYAPDGRNDELGDAPRLLDEAL